MGCSAQNDLTVREDSTTALPPDHHPLRRATWIWPQAYMYLYNHFAHFRRDFTLAANPSKAALFITADKSYKLWVNGNYICRGPARGYQSHWPFDEIDITASLTAGPNWIAVEAYNPGISTFQYIHQTSAGFLCALQCDGFSLASDERWQMRRSKAHRTDTARFTRQMDFQEHVDRSCDDRAWIHSPKAPNDWSAEIFPKGANQFTAFPFGRPPYTTVEPRGIPLLREELIVPSAPVFEMTGDCGDGYRSWKNVSWPWVEEVLDRPWMPAVIASRENSDGREFICEPTGLGRFHAITFPLPRYAVGNVMVNVHNSVGGEILDFQFAERLLEDRPALHKPGYGGMAAMANRLILRAGEQSHEFFHLLGFGVLTVVARDITGPIRVTIRVRHAGYPFSFQGKFECSDTTLHAIHAACSQTQAICALDAYVDTPWREQAQWWGDARIQAKNTFFLDGDVRLLARGIRSIAGQSTPEGLTYGNAPTAAYNCILPDFSLTWLLTLRDHWWQTGDTQLLQELWPRAEQVISYFHTSASRHPSGLLRHDTRFWLFEDWADLFKGEVPTFLNLWYLYTLRMLRAPLRAAGLTKQARILHHEASMHERLVMRYLADKTRSVFHAGLDEGLSPADTPSVHDQILALMLGLLPEGHDGMITHYLLPWLRDENMGCAVPSAFWATYGFEVLRERGYGTHVIDFIRRKWSPMLVTGTTWEGYDWKDIDGNCSVSHAWTAHPSFHLVQILGGIVQTRPGWNGIRFNPCFTEDMARVSVKVPTPRGIISAAWERNASGVHIMLELPSGVVAETTIRGILPRIRGPIRFEYLFKQ